MIQNKEISLFNNVSSKEPTYNIILSDYFELIRSGYWKNDVLSYRNGDKLKKNLPCVTPSGKFYKRNSNGMVGEHTKIIVLDLDYKDNEQIDMEDAKYTLAAEESVLAIHYSVSGNGLAIYILTDDIITYKDYTHIRRTFEDWYGIMLDNSTSDISRLRIVSYDPNIYVNYNAVPFSVPLPKKEMRRHKPVIVQQQGDSTFYDTYQRVNSLIQKHGDPTNTYDKWVRVAFIIADIWGEEGRDMFHLASSFHPEYDTNATNRKYDSILKASKSNSVGVGALINLIKGC